MTNNLLNGVIILDLKLYKYSATPNRVDKSGFLSEIGSVNGVIIKDSTNLMQPTFILKTNPVVYNANYLFCSFTNRYYYIRDVTALTGGRIAITCDIDVLYTYRNEILNSSGWVVRSGTTTDTSDDYKMLHNDYPFRQDFDTLGYDFQYGDDPFSSVSEPNITLIIK